MINSSGCDALKIFFRLNKRYITFHFVDEPPAIKWLNYVQKKSSRPFHERVMKTLVLGPFLFGRAEQPEKWIKYCREVDLLEKDGL